MIITICVLLTGCSKSLEDADNYYQKKEYSEAFKIYKKLADEGDIKALNQVAYMYAGGEGVAKDYSEALKYSKLSADKGNAKGQFNLGIAYLYGFGVVKNNEEALKWFGLAAKQGDVDAQNSYNDLEKHMVNAGELTASAPASAPPPETTSPQTSAPSTPVNIINKPSASAIAQEGKCVSGGDNGACVAIAQNCMRGDYEACGSAAFIYVSGQGGVKIDKTKAVEFAKKGCDGGYIPSCVTYGVMNLNGDGVPENKNRAIELFKKACDLGDKFGCEKLAKTDDSRPYEMVISCTLQGNQGRLEVCFSAGAANTKLDVNQYTYGGSNIMDSMASDQSDGYHRFLPPKYKIRAQNASPAHMLGIKIIDRNSGKVVFFKAVPQYGTIETQNY